MVKELHIPAYVFFPSGAAALSMSFYFREHCHSHDCDFKDLPGPLKIPGFTRMDISDLPDSMQDRCVETHSMHLQMIEKYLLADGILVNSFFELEPHSFNALLCHRYVDIPPVFGVGPLVRQASTALRGAQAMSLKWLDLQPANSVIFVSFGSGGTLSTRQLTELAIGLECSHERFLLVARKPDDGDKSAAYLNGNHMEDGTDYLPQGFIERTKDRAFVLRDWAPQVEILRHPAVGGFLTHCGWNSTLESILHGVPLIAWPLFAEQKMNAAILSEDLKVALRVKENEDGIVESKEIESLANRLMKEEEGHAMRGTMEKLRDLSRSAINEDGSSTKALAYLALKWHLTA